MLDVETLVFGGAASAAPRQIRVMVVGADGFVGRAVAAALARRGRAVVAAVRDPHRGAPLPAAEVVRADLARDTRASWAARLTGVDAVVNAAGAMRGPLDALHARGPAELFLACAEAGVTGVVHVSALGAGEHPGVPFLASKARGDEALLSLARGRPGWHVLRPSVVVGRGGRSTAALLALAAGRRPLRLGPGTWQVQPIHVDDLAELAADLALGAPAPAIVEATGPEVMTTDEVAAALRAWVGLAPARPLALPAAALRLAAAVGRLVPGAALTPDLLALLRAGNVARRPRALGLRRPRPLGLALALDPAAPCDGAAARAARVRPALLAALAAVWIGSGAASLVIGAARADALLAGLGLSGAPAGAVTAAGAALDLALGAAMLAPRLRRAALRAQLAVVALYTALATVALPGLWLDPFAPLLKNAAVAAAAAALLALEG